MYNSLSDRKGRNKSLFKLLSLLAVSFKTTKELDSSKTAGTLVNRFHDKSSVLKADPWFRDGRVTSVLPASERTSRDEREGKRPSSKCSIRLKLRSNCLKLDRMVSRGVKKERLRIWL